MAVVAVAAVLAGAAVPSMTGLMRWSRLTSASQDLFAGFTMARSEAIKRNSRVAVCKSANGVSCAASGGWEQGWIVFHDANNNGMREAGEPVVTRAQAFPGELRVSGNLNVQRYVSYAPNGAARLASGAFQAGTITVCNASAGATDARQIVLSSSGRPRVLKTRLANCA
ncbi:type IVa pilus pseudopilin TppE [Ramlibacter solisilvae]|uniref:Type II secretion system protein H n=2 Tax=Ramlibacter tataouinensis TaxID=94132 RepID=A0A127K1R2_9BURK|nr:hypothetical protein UC35_01800 [Ramlibacter tataouinensis]